VARGSVFASVFGDSAATPRFVQPPPFLGQVKLAAFTGIDVCPFGPIADPLVRGFRQPCHLGHGLFQPLIQGPETLPRGFVFEVQR